MYSVPVVTKFQYTFLGTVMVSNQTVYQFSLNFSYTLLGIVMVSDQTNICFTHAALLDLLYDTVVVSVISLLQYHLEYLSSKTTFCELLYI
jgi:hypothetical protein